MCMNKIITLGISLLFVFSALHAQKIDYDNSSKWFLGFNVGGTWHSSDVKNDVNGGWGITLGKSFNYNYGKRMSFDLRARYLGGRWYGQDNSLTTFDSLSYMQQEYKPLAGYADSSSFSLVNNFQTELHSLSLELVLHANGIRERSGWDPYIFGGIGVKWYQTYGDLLNQDSLGGIYDYSSLGSDVNATSIGVLNDGIFDSALEGNTQDKFSVAVMPSLGLGIGYQVGKRVTLGLEHKTTFTGADIFDGYASEVGKFKQDLYHYTSFYVQFRFRTNARGGGSNNVNNIENYNTNQNNLTNCNTPTVTFRSPESVASITNTQIYNFVADVYNVSIRENVQLFVNGVSTSNFAFNPSTGRLESTLLLNEGSNSIEIKATNSCGPVSSTVSLTYEPCKIPVISLTNPIVTNSAVSVAQFSFSATIQNLPSGQGVSVTQNGRSLSGISYNGNSLSSNVTLDNGVNTFVITATSACGVDTETFTVNYQACLQPAINYITPAANNTTVTSSAYTLSASILNVANNQGVILTQNGKPLNGTTVTAGKLRRNVTLVSGVNTFVITATNSCGTVSETIIINFNDCVPPTIAWTSPSVNNSTVSNANYALVAQIGNVNNAQGVVLTQNGQVLSGSTFAGGILRRNVTLVSGVNTFVITATNACGTVSETIIINFNDCVPPMVAGLSPVQNNANVSNPNLTLTVQLQNIASGQSIVMTQNGSPFTSFTFANGTLTVTATLVQGANIFTLTATNGCGAINESLVINYKPVVETPNEASPTITICHYPPGNNGNPQTIEIPLSAWPAHQAHGDVLGPCPASVPDPEPVPEQKITICHYPPGNNGNPQTIEIAASAWPAHQAHGDVLGPCPASVPDPEPVPEQKITICHYPPGNNGNPQTIEIPLSAWPAHQAHGDVLGPCPASVPDPEPVPEQKITICHYPPGNNGNPQTIEIPLSAWPAHQAHGDVLGPCPASVPDPEPVPEQKITICHYPPGNNGNPQTIEIPLSAWPAHQAHGDVLGPCPASVPDPEPVPEQKITICHYPPGNNGNPQTIEIPLSAWPAHQAHGDVLGPCPASVPDPEPVPEQKITICHYPPGNNGNPQTIEIPLSAWPAHQAHGDILGPCPAENNGENDGSSGNNDPQGEEGSTGGTNTEGTSNGSGFGGTGNVGGGNDEGGNNGGRGKEGEGGKKQETIKPKVQQPKPKPSTSDPKKEEPKEVEPTEKGGDKKPGTTINPSPKGKG
jgi:hypothetical protein